MKTRDIYNATDIDDDTLTITQIENPPTPYLPDFLFRIESDDGDRAVLLSWEQATRLVMAIAEAQNA